MGTQDMVFSSATDICRKAAKSSAAVSNPVNILVIPAKKENADGWLTWTFSPNKDAIFLSKNCSKLWLRATDELGATE